MHARNTCSGGGSSDRWVATLLIFATSVGSFWVIMSNFCCSIEMEPKTLSEGQISHARDVAVDIVENKESNEASSIFVEGLKPVITVKKMAEIVQNGDLLYKVDKSKDKTEITGSSCQCSLTSAVIDSPDQSKLKEPLSAPF